MNVMDMNDSHICIRCKQTINGLDNYVEHRKNGNCEPISAHKYFNCLQLQCKYKSVCNDNEEEVDEDDDEVPDDDRSVTSDVNQSYNQSEDEVSEEEVDIYRPPNNFTGGKWKPGSHPHSLSSGNHRLNANTIASYNVIDFSSGDESGDYDHRKRRSSNQSFKSTSTEDCEQSVVTKSLPTNQLTIRSKSGKQFVDLSANHVIADTCLTEEVVCNTSDIGNELICKLCDYKALNSIDLLKHYLNSSNHSAIDVFGLDSIAESETNLMKKLSFICQMCSFYTNQSNNYFWHLTTPEHNLYANSRSTHFICLPCGQTCRDVEKLMAHMETSRANHSNSSGPLIICKYRRVKHKSVDSVNSVTNRYKCDFCGQIFNFKTHLKRHTITKHIRRVAFPDLIKSNFIGDNAEYCCQKCDFKTDRQSTHLLHSINHEMPVPSTPTSMGRRDGVRRSEDKYGCPVCRKAYICRELKQHINIHLNETPFECIQCDKKFTKLVYLRNHEKTHTSIKDKVCETCGSHFANNKLLKTHIKIHDLTRQRTFRCDVCGAKFYSKFVLETHLKRHLPKTDRQFKCQINGCHHAFVKKSELLEHQKVHLSSDEKSLLCDQCGHKTNSLSALRKHYRQHTGDKHFECPKCPFKAYLSSNLSRHMRTHTGAKPYQCPYCSYVCNTQENIRKHILKTKKHQGLYVYPCTHCDHKTNLFNEYRSHLLDKHSDLYTTDQIDGLVSHLFSN